MTKQVKVCFLVSLALVFGISCKQAEKTKPIKAVLQNKDSCACGDMEPKPPPPPENFVISIDSIFHKEGNKSRLFIVSLIAGKKVDLEGRDLQIFHIKANNHDKKEFYDFALPSNYNKYWNEFHIYKNSQKKEFNIGFRNTDSNFIHLMYSVSLDTLPFNLGRIRINFKEQKIKEVNIK